MFWLMPNVPKVVVKIACPNKTEGGAGGEEAGVCGGIVGGRVCLFGMHFSK